ncbi:hypothetical protein E2562_034270 [Oryza meyeriana var. granulata]|uniref:Ubiquitin-like protease family profile domain-containing protein n=1 Tax=Oryza meyeriana var. granulata TaxID=110450 RepID=A0A6G1ESC9_9ORYZ|nr:hypothetical protein E2562_034270 [Oryza meyeriana var. granulata]KAF0927564.1 hypothetical protein E2562_034270 [Oryza meyeriana var. granulata]
MRRLHNWYMAESKKGTYHVGANYTNDDFCHGDGTIWLGFEQLFHLYQLDSLDICIMQIWILRCMMRAQSNKLDIGFLDPQIMNKTMVLSRPDDVVDYISCAFERHTDKDKILVPYLMKAHWILLVLETSRDHIVVMDSRRKDQSEFQEVLDVFNRAFGHYKKSTMKSEFSVRVGFQCLKQPPGNNCCGFYAMRYMMYFTDDYFHINDEEGMDTSSLLDHTIWGLQDEFAGFIVREIIDPKGVHHLSR